MLLAPDSWPGVPESITIGPWEFPGPVVIANLALLALAAIDGLLAGNPDGIEIEREMPRALALNVRGDVAWHVRNPGGVRRTVSFGDEFAPSLRAGTRRARVALPGQGQATIATQIIPSRRGDFEIDELVVRVDGPLGLGSRQRATSSAAAVSIARRGRPANKQGAHSRSWFAVISRVGLRH